MKAILEFTHDITSGTLLVNSGQTFVCGDAAAHEIRFTAMDGAGDADLSGYTCKAYCVLSNRATATEDAAITGNVITVTLPEAFYAVAGSTALLLRLLKDGAKYDVLCMGYTIRAGTTSTVYDPAGQLPDLSDFQAAIDDCEAATAAANTAADAANAAEAGRVLAETGRVNAETARVGAETTRQSNEQTRQTKEGQRQTAETGRASSEQGRASAESVRVTQEAARVAAETGRVNAETARAATFATQMDDAQDATDAANLAATAALAAAADPTTHATLAYDEDGFGYVIFTAAT